ncbi:alpha-mannosyltransferase [beta proteobacterium AAP99]|nr:alpha-mannosyltransferase [beta proteobacterium AAP99]
MRIVIVTDAWHPQTNGVVFTWTYMQRELGRLGHEVQIVHPNGHRTIGMPSYPEIRLSTEPGRIIRAALTEVPDRLHIATEGPLGLAARRHALARGWQFTTSYHTKFPEYVHARVRIPLAWTYTLMRRFHRPSRAVLAPTQAMVDELRGWGFAQAQVWGRGVDQDLFQPGVRDALDLPRPIFMNIGRVAVEKNLEAFCELDLPGSKVVVGDGPARARLQRQYPQVHWLGMVDHAQLAPLYRAADVFVFPSRTDTFGLVLLEAMACGTPVAAYPVTGPIDVVPPRGGVLSEDLTAACRAALTLDRNEVAALARNASWQQVARDLLAQMQPTLPERSALRSAA